MIEVGKFWEIYVSWLSTLVDSEILKRILTMPLGMSVVRVPKEKEHEGFDLISDVIHW